MFNGCKAVGCTNLGNSNVEDYQKTNRLGYPAYYCPVCGSYPPLLESTPITNLIKQNRKAFFSRSYSVCPQCVRYFFTHRRQTTESIRYGKTAAGTERRVCSVCHTGFSTLNSHRIANKLQSLFDVVIQANNIADIRQQSGLNSSAFYKQLKQLSDLLRQFSRKKEQEWLATKRTIAIQTTTTKINSRSGKLGKDGVSLWFLSSSESETGYQLIQTHNLNFSSPTLSSSIPTTFLGEYLPDNEEPQVASDVEDLLDVADKTYSKILDRIKFDELHYSSSTMSKSVEGVLIRPVYAAHCHFQLLKSMLRANTEIVLYLEHESFVRGACIWSFNKRVKQGSCILYYLTYSRCYKLNTDSQASRKRMLGWWNEPWVQTKHEWQNVRWNIAFGYLTHKNREPSELTRPDWNQEFWDQFENWLPESERRKTKFRITLQWLEIYRYIYNYVLTDRLPIKNINPRSIASICQSLD